MRIKYLVLAVFTLCHGVGLLAQNVGVNTTTPQAALDINGDIIIRPTGLIVADGITVDLDVNTSKYSYYRITGPTADFTIAGITAGIDGRLITLFNRSGFTLQLNNEDPGVAPADAIITGTTTDITIINKGVVSLQYDEAEQKWIVKSSSRGSSGIGAGYWELNGNDIYNINTGNVGIGTSSPVSSLTIQTGINTTGWTHIGGIEEIIVNEAIGGIAASIGTMSPHVFRLKANGDGKVHIYPTGQVIVGTSLTPAVGKFTVETDNNSDGISHISTAGNILKTRIGGTSAGIGTFSNTNMRIFCNSASVMIFDAANGNVGIGTETTNTYRLSVNGTIRAKELRVNTGWADYVFEPNYTLLSLTEVEQFIKLHKHLPGIPPASQLIKDGVDVSDMQTKMMAKIEELTLYLIEANKTINELTQRVNSFEGVKK